MKDDFAVGVVAGVLATVAALAGYARHRRSRFVRQGEPLSSHCPTCDKQFRYGHPSQRRLAFDLHMLTEGCWEDAA